MMIKKSALLLSLLFLPVASIAQVNPTIAQATKFGGGMAVLGTQCKQYSAAEIAALKAQQKSMAPQQGVSTAQFEQLYAQGQAEATAKWKAMDAGQRQQACQQAAAMRQMGQQYGR